VGEPRHRLERPPCAVVDQRGVKRPQNGRCDAGAFEFVGSPPPADDTPPETIFDPATDRPKQDGFETMAFTFRGTDNVTVRNELNFECRLIEIDLTEQQDPVAPWDPIPPELMWNGCSSPRSVPLFEEGLLTFGVRVIDRAGNVDPTPVIYLLDGSDLQLPAVHGVRVPPGQPPTYCAVRRFSVARHHQG
jgi:hypothetical protein